MRSRRYDIPVKFLLQVGDDEELVELGRAGLPYPYNAKTAIPRLLRELAKELERGDPDDGAKAR
jgi:hypothetical protein